MESLLASGIYRGFDERAGTTLIVLRMEQIPMESSQKCAEWKSAVATLPSGTSSYEGSFMGWGPWAEYEREPIEECDKFPCDVKLSKPEIEKLKSSSAMYRKKIFLDLVKERVENYLKTQSRPEYEFAGRPADPFQLFEFNKYSSKQDLPDKPKLFLRNLDFAPGKFRVVRQVLDRRELISENSATVWVRDVYNAHYFEAWGEFYKVECHLEKKFGRVFLAITPEVDNLKSTDLFSLIGRGKIRREVRRNGDIFLDERMAYLKRLGR